MPLEPAAAILARYATVRRIRGLTRLLDTRWTVPGTRWRFGLDPVIGLVPVAGDVITLALSVWLLIESRRIGAPRRMLVAMGGNIALDFLLGAVPLLGDVFDFAFKANVRNLNMLERWMSRAMSVPTPRPARTMPPTAASPKAIGS